MTVVKAATDSWVFEGTANKNNAQSERLWVDDNVGQIRASYIFFPRPFPLNAQIPTATLKLRLAEAWSGTDIISAKRIVQSWGQNSISWNNRPNTVDTNAGTVTFNGGAVNAEVSIDVSALMTDVSLGDDYFGIKLSTDGNLKIPFHSADARNLSLRPTLELTWSTDPIAPTRLTPSGGASVSTATPIMSWDYNDAANGNQTKSKVEISTVSNFASTVYTSGANPVTNLRTHWNPSGFVATPGTTYYWRVRVEDNQGNLSGWSDTAEFTRSTSGTLTIVNPPTTGITNLVTNPSFEVDAANWFRHGNIRTNFVTNPSFEVDTAGWAVVSAGDTLTRVLTSPKYGTACCQVATNGADPNEGAALNNATLCPAISGETITMSIWMRGNVGGELVQLRLSGRNSGGTQVETSQTLVTLTTSWQRVTVTRTLNQATTAYVTIHPETQTSQPAMTYFIDGAMIEKAAAVSDYFDGSILGGAWLGTAHASASTAARVNLVTNPSFETNTTGWTHNVTSLATSTEQKLYSSSSGKLTFNGTTGYFAGYAVTLPEPGDYWISAWVYIPTGWNDGAIRMSHDGSFVGSTQTSSGTGWSESTTTTGSWQRITIKLAVVSTDLAGTFYVRHHTTSPVPASGDVIYIDGVMIVKADTGEVAPPTYFDGTTSGGVWTGTAHASASTSSAVLTRVTKDSKVGAASLRVAADERAGSGAISSAITVVAGTQYRANAWVKADEGKRMRIRITDAVSNDQTLWTASGKWERVSVTRTIGTGATTAQVSIFAVDAGVQTFYTDGVILGKANDIPTQTYFDGANGAAWSGTAHASSSVMPTVEETTPPVSWTFTGRTQESVRVTLQGWPIGVLPDEENPTQLWRMAQTVTAATSFTIPANLLKTGRIYRVIVEVWDTIKRQSISGDLAQQKSSRYFMYNRDGLPDPTTNLTVTNSEGPSLDIRWSRAEEPDFFSVRINGTEELQRIEPYKVRIGASTNFRLTWWRAVPGVPAEVEVEAVVLDATKLKHSRNNPTVTITPRPGGKYLVDDTDQLNPLVVSFLGKDAADLTLGETGETFLPPGSGKPIRIVDSQRGLEGSISGILDGRDMISRFEKMKRWFNDVRYIQGTRNIPVILGEASESPSPDAEMADVSVEVFQTGEFVQR